MKVQLGTWEITDEQRRDLKRWLNERGMASREDCRQWVHQSLNMLMEEVSKEVAEMPPLRRRRRRKEMDEW